MFDVIHREIIYVSYYFMVQLRQIFFYWVLGMVIGSFISVFAKDAIHGLFGGLKDKKWACGALRLQAFWASHRLFVCTERFRLRHLFRGRA